MAYNLQSFMQRIAAVAVRLKTPRKINGVDFDGTQDITINAGGDGGSPGGADTQIQYNNDGAFAGNSGLVYKDGNVGIGTASPNSTLELAGGLGSVGLRMSYAASTTAYSNSIENSLSGTAGGHTMSFNLTSNNVKTTPLKLAADGEITFTGTPVFNGDVAINRGSASPVASLEVGNTAISGGEAFAMSYASDASYRSGFITSVSGGLITSNTHTFFVKTGLSGSTSANIWTALGNGNMGVGTLLPTANFQVAQPTQGIGRVSNSAGGTTVTGSQTQFKNTFKVGDTITIGGQTVVISAIASNTSMTTALITNANTTASYTMVGGVRLSVSGNGNVGINTTTPTEKLDVVGNAKVSGTIQGSFKASDGSAGATGTFTTADSKTVTVKNGLITDIA